MDESTFAYLPPTEAQKETMNRLREAAAIYADTLNNLLSEGPDKTYLMRKLREVAMWANVSVTRNANGTPRA